MPASPAGPRGRRGGVWALLARLHFYAGVFVAPFLVTTALTGLAYMLVPQLDAFVYHHYLHPARVEQTSQPLVDKVRAARQVHPEGTIAAIAPPDGADSTTRVVLDVPELGEKQRTVHVDPYTSRVRGALTTWFGETPLNTWFDDLHRNLHLGVVGRHYSELAASWLWVIVGGGLLLVVVWGYRMWWQRRPTRADRHLRLGRPPARGPWRALPLAVVVPGVVVVAAVGWALPMLGAAHAGGQPARLSDRRRHHRAPPPPSQVHHAPGALT